MTRYEIEQELDSLYRDYEIACNSDEDVVCKAFNTDSKKSLLNSWLARLILTKPYLKNLVNQKMMVWIT